MSNIEIKLILLFSSYFNKINFSNIFLDQEDSHLL